jgi:hypothetical protein
MSSPYPNMRQRDILQKLMQADISDWRINPAGEGKPGNLIRNAWTGGCPLACDRDAIAPCTGRDGVIKFQHRRKSALSLFGTQLCPRHSHDFGKLSRD